MFQATEMQRFYQNLHLLLSIVIFTEENADESTEEISFRMGESENSG
jgi:hypothetical protein